MWTQREEEQEFCDKSIGWDSLKNILEHEKFQSTEEAKWMTSFVSVKMLIIHERN